MNLRKTLEDKIFWMLAISLAGIFFVATINSNRAYQAEIKILFLPKNEITASNMDQVLGNAQQISSLTVFHDKMVERNPEIDNGAAELSIVERKDFWNSIIKVRRVKESGIVKITASNDSQTQATMIARQGAETMIASMSHFYNIKTELDMRIVDGPIISQVEKINTIVLFFMSLFLGMILGFIFNTLVDFFVKRYVAVPIQPRHQIQITKTKPAPSIFPRFSLSDNMKMESKAGNKSIFDFRVEEEEALVQKKETTIFPITREKKASAPENLPVAEDFDFELSAMPEEETQATEDMEKKEDSRESADVVMEKKIETLEPVSAPEPEEDVYREATAEEVKARLNKLLSGDMLK